MLTAGSVSPPAETPIVAIVGPTASGKTEVAVALAEALGGEIISADSVAVYRGLDVGSAKPDARQRARAAFHLIDIAEPDEPFSVARFKQLAERAVADIRARRRRPLLVGGTGLYVRVLLEDYGLTETAADPAIRDRLDAQAREQGAPALHARLAAADPIAAARIHPNDRVRIVRALEVLLRTSRTISEQQAEDAARRTRRPAYKFGLTAPREVLCARIDARVDAMIAGGLVDEVRGLLARGYAPELLPLGSLGYKEIAAHLRGETTLADAVEQIKRQTRRFAKRQLTWFRADPEIHWMDVAGLPAGEVAARIAADVRRAEQPG